MVPSKLHIGCGRVRKYGYVNLDIMDGPGVDVKHDLDVYPWPFETNQFDEIFANSVLEHIGDLLPCFGEMHRILKPGGVLKGGVPFYNYRGAFGDPTHKQFFTKSTFNYLKKDSRYNYVNQTGEWEIIKLDFTPTIYGKIIPRKILHFLGGFIGNLVHKIEFELKVVKSV